MGPRAAHQPPEGTIVVSVHLPVSGSLRQERTQIILDGAPIPDGVPVPSLDPLHTVGIVVDASLPCGLLSSPRATIRVQAARTVLGTASAAVDFYVLDSGDLTKEPLDRLRGKWAFHGARIWPDEYSFTSVLPFPARCDTLGAVDRAKCRVEAVLDNARKHRDVALSICTNARLAAMADVLPQADAGDSNATATVFRLEREALACQGEQVAFLTSPPITEQTGCGVEPPVVESFR